MVELVRGPGRPKVRPEERVTPKDGMAEVRRKRAAQGIVERRFLMHQDDVKRLDAMMTAAGFGPKEQSEFLAALLLVASGQPYFGPPFSLPINLSESS